MSIRTLPKRVTPLDDEAVDSWTESLAIAHQAQLGEVAPALALPWVQWPPWVVSLTGEQSRFAVGPHGHVQGEHVLGADFRVIDNLGVGELASKHPVYVAHLRITHPDVLDNEPGEDVFAAAPQVGA